MRMTHFEFVMRGNVKRTENEEKGLELLHTRVSYH